MAIRAQEPHLLVKKAATHTGELDQPVEVTDAGMELQAGSASDAVVFAQEQQPGETRLGVSRSAQLAPGNIH